MEANKDLMAFVVWGERYRPDFYIHFLPLFFFLLVRNFFLSLYFKEWLLLPREEGVENLYHRGTKEVPKFSLRWTFQDILST